MVTVLRLTPQAYGAAVRRELSERLQREQSVGAVYATLQRLEDKGLLTSEMSDPEPTRGGRAKRFFRVTAPGTAAVKAMQRIHTNLLADQPPRWRPA